jgi:hypothetical protein
MIRRITLFFIHNRLSQKLLDEHHFKNHNNKGAHTFLL